MAAAVDHHGGTSQSSHSSHNNNNIMSGILETTNNGDAGESQESFTQHTNTQLTHGDQLTQLGYFDDNDSKMRSPLFSPAAAVDPLTIPWGKLISQNSNGGVLEMTPRPPPNNGDNSSSNGDDNAQTFRFKSPRSINNNNNNNNMSSASRTPSTSSSRSSSPCGGFMGLRNVKAGDRFNEYTLGRSVKADVTVVKLFDNVDNDDTTKSTDTTKNKQSMYDYVHSSISNKHCRIFCITNNTNNTNTDVDTTMEVYVEDTSGNGTLINNTTLLRKNERRKLHTGDVVCLVNPQFIMKRIRSCCNGGQHYNEALERKLCVSQYSYVFVNLWEQEVRGGGCSNGGISPKYYNNSGWRSGGNSNGAAVNARAVKMHSAQPKSGGGRRDVTNAATGGYCAASTATRQSMTNATTATTNDNHSKNNNSNSLSSFLNDPTSNSNKRKIEQEYDIREPLGTGTCGEVRRAIHRHSGNERAVKIIKIGHRHVGISTNFSREQLDGIQAEAEILRSLNHPYIVKLYDVYVSPGQAIYLVMELVRGGDLFDRIVERGRYTEVRARRLMRRVLAAVYHLHEERGIVHRDLKPENILVVNRRSDIDIKLTDFGVAKNMTAEGLKTFCGTPQYFAPEVLKRRNTVKGDGRYGKEIDCWSIGVILFILLSGSPPFEVTADFDAVADGRIEFYDEQWKDISSDAKDLVVSLLQKDPTKRMGVKEACEHAWVLKEDGDTHCHPLSDPLISKVAPTKPAAASDEEDTANLTDGLSSKVDTHCASLTSKESVYAKLEEGSVSTKLDSSRANLGIAKLEKGSVSTKLDNSSANLGAEELANTGNSNYLALPELTSNECEAGTTKSLATMPPPNSTTSNQRSESSTNQDKAHDLKENRQSSILPYDNGKSVTKAISQAMDVSLKSPIHGSPIHRKKLFLKDADGPAKAELTDTARKISKANVSSIKSAGESLPKPVLQTVTQNKPKKEKGINSYFAAATKTKNAESFSFQQASSKNAITEKKRKQESTITPPVGEQLVFSLNKRIKIDAKYRKSENDKLAGSREDGPSASKAELSEDELQSDFSDAEDIQEPDNYTYDNSARRVSSASNTTSLKQQCAMNKVTNITCKGANNAKESKKIQSYLFGKTPLDTKNTENDQEYNTVATDPTADECIEPRAVTSDSKSQSTNNMSCDSTSPEHSKAVAVSKGNQKTIKSWFLPKTKNK